jgi:monoterpene epsilon-lactone hydrolase
MARPEIEALREQFRTKDVLGMISVTDMRNEIEQLAVIDPTPLDVTLQRITIGAVDAEWIRPPEVRRDRVILYLHGGGYVIGSVNSHRSLVARIARASKVQALALDYRRAPENPFPAPVEDATASYRWLLVACNS